MRPFVNFLLVLVFISIPLLQAKAASLENSIRHQCGKSHHATINREHRVDSLHAWDALQYDLLLEPGLTENTLTGRVEVRFASTSALLDTLDLHFEGYELGACTQEGQTLNPHREGARLLLPLNFPVTQGDSSSVLLHYSGVPPQRDGLGMVIQSGRLYTVSDPWGTRLWVPCYDEPHDKARWNFNVRLPSQYTCLANGTLVSQVDEGETQLWQFEHPFPMSSYLASLVAGNHVEVLDSWGDLPLRWLVYPSHVGIAQTSFSRVDQMLDCFSGLWGEYPFNGYAMGEAGIYGGLGGMEHQTCTTIGSGIVAGGLTYESVVAHELAHQWWGDAVTPVDFRQVWMNEGWATYAEAYFEQHLAGGDWDSFVSYLRQIQQTYISWDSEFLPIFEPPLSNLFNTSQYEKAASVIHMLRLLMGEEAFHQAQETWLSDNNMQTVDTWQYQDAMEIASGLDLNWFFQQWIFAGGFPTYRTVVQSELQGEQTLVYLSVSQEHQTLDQFRMPVPVQIKGATQTIDTLLWLEEPWQDFLFTMEDEFDTLLFNHDSWILCRHLPSVAPGPFELTVEDFLFDDVAGGNGDGDLETGESAFLQLKLKNNGGWQTQVQLDPSSSELELQGSWPAIASWGAGESRWMPPGHVQVEHMAAAGMRWTELGIDLSLGGSFWQSMVARLPLGDPWLALAEQGSQGLFHYYREELDSLTLFSDRYTLDELASNPGLPLSAEYEAAICYSGNAGFSVSPDTLQQLVQRWVIEDQKSLMLSGQDALDLIGEGGLFGSGIADVNGGGMLVDGEDGTAFSGMSALLIGTEGAANQYSPSTLSILPEDEFAWQVLARYRDSNEIAMMFMETGEEPGLLLLCGFGLEGISGMGGTSTRLAWLEQVALTLGGPELEREESSFRPESAFSLSRAWPNPFNPVTQVELTLRETAKVQCRVYDLRGSLQAVLADEQRMAGTYRLLWDASSMASGIYFLELSTEGSRSEVRKLLLVK